MTEPGKPLAMSDFFGLEAGEYLERLDGLLGKPDPSPEEFVRLARALRGSALMANQPPIARAAAGLEALGRAVREGRRAWDPQATQLAIRAVDDLKIFVRKVGSWTDVDTAKAGALATELDQLAGRPSSHVRAAEALGLDAGARAFVAREGAAIASALDRAATALRANPQAPDPSQQVLRALQPLRGLAALGDLPPLPDLLDGIERAVAEAQRAGHQPNASIPDLFQGAAIAIARAAREVADQGRPNPDALEFRHFAGLLVQLLDGEPGVVAVSSLFYDDAGPHVVHRGVAAARPTTLGRVEIVSHGEHLRQAADSLERAPSLTQLELRAHTLAGTFRALANAGGGALADRVAQFALVAREVVTSGAAVRAPQEFAACLRRMGDVLARSEMGDEAALAGELDGLIESVRVLAGPGAPPAPATLAPIPPPPRRSAPVTAPAPVAAPSRTAAAETARDTTPEGSDLQGSWTTYQRLVAAGVRPASLEELLSAVTPTVDLPLVDIRSLLYRGPAALARAQALRAEAQQASGDALRALFDEVCDLVALALEPTP